LPRGKQGGSIGSDRTLFIAEFRESREDLRKKKENPAWSRWGTSETQECSRAKTMLRTEQGGVATAAFIHGVVRMLGRNTLRYQRGEGC